LASVLLVNDDAVSLSTTAALLRLAGHDVITAATGLDAVTAAGCRPFDLFLIDLQLPDISGLEVISRLRSRGLTGRKIIVTAFPTFSSSFESARCGADGYVDGPVFGDELIAIVERALTSTHPVTRGATAGPAGLPIVDERIAEVIRIVLHEIGSPITPAALAARVGLSESRLRHLFHAETGVTLSKYVLRQRLDGVARQLGSSFEHVRQIAFNFGLTNLRHFRRAFRAQYGVTPKEYRRRFGHGREAMRPEGAAAKGR
jgi:two-component system, response regulator YesN